MGVGTVTRSVVAQVRTVRPCNVPLRMAQAVTRHDGMGCAMVDVSIRDSTGMIHDHMVSGHGY